MKVLDLSCANDHRFEGWFGSEEDFQSQQGKGLIECPMCGDHHITRLPSAPRLNVSGAREPAAPTSPPSATTTGPSTGRPAPSVPREGAVATVNESGADSTAQAMKARFIEAVKHVVANSEDVGTRFAEEARRIHYGEAQERAIRGQASLDEARELHDEGIEVVALPLPPSLKGTLQ